MLEASPKKSPQLLDLLAYRLPPKLDQEARQQRSRNLLLRALEQDTTIAFLGAGISQPFGYPDWRKLGFKVLKRTLEALESLKDNDPRVAGCLDYISSLSREAKALDKLDKLEADALMFMIGACKSALTLAREDLVDSVYYTLFKEQFTKAPSPK